MYMTARRSYTALILSVIALFVSACDKTCPGGPDSNVVEKIYRFEIVNQSGIDLTLSFESPAMPPEQTGFTPTAAVSKSPSQLTKRCRGSKQ